MPRGAAISSWSPTREAGVQIAAGGAVGFALDGDPVVAGVGLTREGVVAEQRPLLAGSGWTRTVRYWPGRGGGKRCAGGVFEPDGDHGVALAVDLGDGQLAEPGPGRRRARDREAGIAAAGPSVEQGAERRLPAGAESRDPQRSEELLARVSGQVEERVDLGDRHLLRPGGELDDLVARLHLALFEHAEVEARAAVRDEQRGDARVVHADPDAVAGDARLGDLEDGGADPVAVADAHLVVAEPLDREVLAELSVDEVASSELAFPVPVRVDLVDEHRALLAAVPAEIALAVAVDVEPAHAARAGDGILEDAREHGPPLPGHVLRQADVDRHQDARGARSGFVRGDALSIAHAGNHGASPGQSRTILLRWGPGSTPLESRR